MHQFGSLFFLSSPVIDKTHLSQPRDVANSGSIRSYPDDVGGGGSTCRTFNGSAGRIAEVYSVRGFFHEYRADGLVLA